LTAENVLRLKLEKKSKYLTQVINEFPLGRIAWKNRSSISGKNNSWPDFIYLVVKLWITRNLVN
jgi:hypothetical protein